MVVELLERNKCELCDDDRHEGYISWLHGPDGISTNGSVRWLLPVDLEVVDNPCRILHPC